MEAITQTYNANSGPKQRGKPGTRTRDQSGLKIIKRKGPLQLAYCVHITKYIQFEQINFTNRLQRMVIYFRSTEKRFESSVDSDLRNIINK